jgi:hypothetical protein
MKPARRFILNLFSGLGVPAQQRCWQSRVGKSNSIPGAHATDMAKPQYFEAVSHCNETMLPSLQRQ